MVTARDILIEAAETMDSLGWTQRAPARDRHGRRVAATAPTAVRFSLIGAIDRAAILLDASGREHWRAIKQAAYTIAGMPVGVVAAFGIPREYNDAPQRTRPEVVAVLREAAAELPHVRR